MDQDTSQCSPKLRLVVAIIHLKYSNLTNMNIGRAKKKGNEQPDTQVVAVELGSISNIQLPKGGIYSKVGHRP